MKTKQAKRQNLIPTLVERGFAIHQQLAVLNDEFKKIKTRLKEEAVARPGDHVPLLENDSDGKQWIAVGDGCECHIVFPEDKLNPEIDPLASDFLAIRSLAGAHFTSLFRKVTLYRHANRKTFRTQASRLLSPKAASELIEFTSTPTEPKAVWKARATQKE